MHNQSHDRLHHVLAAPLYMQCFLHFSTEQEIKNLLKLENSYNKNVKKLDSCLDPLLYCNPKKLFHDASVTTDMNVHNKGKLDTL